MEASHSKKLHPVLWVAAVAVILLSLSGIGAIFGWIPTVGSKPADPLAAAPPIAEPAQPAPAAAATEVNKAASPAPARIAKAERSQHTHASEQPPGSAPPAVAQNAPPVCRDCGVIESVREIEEKGQGTGLGAVAGGVVGGLLGNQVGRGRGKDAMTVVGAVGGAVAGHQVEKTVRKTVHYEVVVRFDDGTSRVFNQDAPPAWRQGDRVRVQNGAIVARN